MTDSSCPPYDWYGLTTKQSGRKTLLRLVAPKKVSRNALDQLAHRARSHYISDEHIDTHLDNLGYQGTAKMLRHLYPRTARARSGDLGEILGTEMVEEHCGYRVPIRKLRHKDHREQPMRGEDIIGIRDRNGSLGILKGEAKSANSLSSTVIESARLGLEANDGRPSAHALAFVAHRLLDSQSGSDQALGSAIAAGCVKSIPKERVAHCLFALTGNRAKALAHDFRDADGTREQFVVQLQIHDQPRFIRRIYKRLDRLAFD